MKSFKYSVIGLLSAIILLSGMYACKKEKDQKIRILTLGIRNESNTFSTLSTQESNFKELRGNEVFKDQLWAAYLQEEGIEIIPTLHAYAWPGGVVEKSVFEKYKNEILDSIRHAGTLDAIYMDMHGALHVEGYVDAQATLIKEIRDIVGNDVVIGGSFDLHGNLSDEFVSKINVLSAYRTAPHRDGAETKLRAVKLIVETLRENLKPVIESVTIPILVPGEKSITEVEPLHTIYAQIPLIAEKEGIMDASVFAGYCWADLPRSAMRVFVVAKDKKYTESARLAATNLANEIWDKRKDMVLDVPSGSIDEMLNKLKAYKGKKTVFISDSGDNTTAGAPGDNPQVLEAILKHGITNVLIAGVVDTEALEKCKNAGLGSSVTLDLGGRDDNVFGKPLSITGKITFLSDSDVINTARGTAVVDVKGTKVAILNGRRSFVAVKDFEEIGLDPLSFDAVVVKLGYLYPELRDIAPVHLMALTSGFCNLDMTTLPFQHVNRPAYPLDPDMSWNADM